MKIVKVTSFFHPVTGGMEIHMLNESKELIKLGHEVSIYTSNSLREGKIEGGSEIINKIKVNRFNTWFKLSYFTPVFPKVFLKALFDNYDVLHSHSYRQPHNITVLIAKLRGKKAFLSMHWPEYPKELRSNFMNFFIPMFDNTFGQILLKFSDKLIVQSEDEKNWLINKFNVNKNKVKIIPPGIEEIYLKKVNTNNFKNKFKIKSPIILYLGRIHESKGIERLISIAKDIKATIVIAGTGEYSEILKISAKELKNIIFTGKLTEQEKIEAISSCDIFCSPSNYEAYGITLVEAMAQSKAVIGSNVGGIPSTIGDCGYTFNKDDLTDLKVKIKLLLKNKKLRESFGKKGFKKAKELTWNKIAKDLVKLYEN